MLVDSADGDALVSSLMFPSGRVETLPSPTEKSCKT